jgi:gamma-D-glutamyl-L-lysine dipeptidyl-peptidase
MTIRLVGVDVATVWSDPDAPRPIDAPALEDRPDLEAWTSRLSIDDRIGLHGRCETQLLRGEPVVVVHEYDDWVRIAAPWQPSPDDDRGYPGWIRRAHLAADGAGASGPVTPPVAHIEATSEGLLRYAREFIGLRYLWGGVSPWGIDCSGLVHLAFRHAGLVVPRDAEPQCKAATPVARGDERPGDLYFFAKEDGYVYHVGFVTGPDRMLHAPEASQNVEDTPLSGRRLHDLAAVGRFL